MTTVPTIDYEKIKGVKNVPLEELYTSGHRTCQGCESATTMRGFIKSAGARTVAQDRSERYGPHFRHGGTGWRRPSKRRCCSVSTTSSMCSAWCMTGRASRAWSIAIQCARHP